jgi:pyruvate/2-oxoglutarate dehydrogenase complex dihydrolipoamide dehydrogenase (E3) component
VTAYLEAAVQRLGVEIWLNAEADVDGLLALQPDAIFIATGSQPDLPNGLAASDRDAGGLARSSGLHVPLRLPGLDRACVRSVDQVLAETALSSKHVLLIDAHGHWEASGTAEYLADLGCSVEVVTSRAEVGFGLEATNKVMFHQRALVKGIRLTPSVEVTAIEDDGVVVVDLLSGEERRIADVDIVVPVYPRTSRDDLYFQLLERLGDDPAVTVNRIGDASAPRMIQTIMLEAQQVAMEL